MDDQNIAKKIVNHMVDNLFAVTENREEYERRAALQQLIVNNDSVLEDLDMIRQWQERFEQLSYEDKIKIRAHFLNIFDILGVEPGAHFEEGQNYFQWFQFLITNVYDLIVRTGRNERLIEQILAYLSTQGFTQKSTQPPPLAELKQNEKISTHIVEEPTEAIYASDMSDRVSKVPGVSGVHMLLRSQDFRRDVQSMTKPQLMKKYGVSDSTIVRVKRLLRQQGFNI